MALENIEHTRFLEKEIEELKLQLREEKQEKKYYLDLLFKKAGILVVEEENLEINLEEMKPVRKFHSLSSIRREAEQEARKSAGILNKNEMSEAERIFQENLDSAARK